MKFSLQKDFCLWVVPSNDGRVRKIRFTLQKLLCIAFFCVLVASTFMFIAGDYTRVQIDRARKYFSLLKVTHERNKLADTNDKLENKVQDLRKIGEHVLSYEQNLRKRVDELSSMIDTAATMGVIPPIKEEHNSRIRDDIGGAEVDCGNGARCWGDNANGLSSLRESVEFPGIEEDLLERVDKYVDILRQVPLGSPGNGHVSSAYGLRRSPFTGRKQKHQGIDFSLPWGSEIVSTAEGVVKSVKRTRMYGIMIDIVHNNKVTTRYAHLSKPLVKVGERVCRGEVIGLVGSTGRSTGPHLHYEVLINKKSIDPISLMQLAEHLAGVM